MNWRKIVYYALVCMMVILVFTGNIMENIALDRLGTIFLILTCIIYPQVFDSRNHAKDKADDKHK